MTSGEPTLVREQRGAVLVLRLNRPEARNALNSDLIGGLGAGLAAAESDAGTRAVVLTGTGDRAFCAGMDLAELRGGRRDPDLRRTSEAMAVFSRFIARRVSPSRSSVPPNATAVAGGFELLLSCDVVVASEDAKFGLPEVKRGTVRRRRRRLPRRRASRWRSRSS